MHADSSDLEASEYLRLKELLSSTHLSFPTSRYLYLIGREETGSIFYYVDSEPESSSNYAPPGELCDEANEEFHLVFDTLSSRIISKCPQENQSTMTVLVPILNPSSGELVTVFGMDSYVDDSATVLLRSIKEPVLTTFFLLAAVALSLGLLHLAKLRGIRYLVRYIPPEAVIVFWVGISATLCLAFVIRNAETSRNTQTFNQLAEAQTKTFTSEFDFLVEQSLQGLAVFFESSRDVSEMEFLHFTKNLKKDRSILAWSWSPLVQRDNLTNFETEQRENGNPGFRVWEKSPLGENIPVSSRDFYCPVMFIQPQKRYASIIGFDLASTKDRLDAIKNSLRSGIPCATNPITFIEEAEGGRGMIAFAPVYGDPYPSTPQGFVQLVLRFDDVISSTVNNNNYSELLSTRLTKFSSNGNQILLTSNISSKQSFEKAKESFSAPIYIFDKAFILKIIPNKKFDDLNPLVLGKYSAASGFIISFCISFLVAFLIRRKETLEELILLRTAELSSSERRFRDLFEKSADGNIIIHKHRYYDCNQATANLFKLPRSEIINRSIADLSPEFQPDGSSSFAKSNLILEQCRKEGMTKVEWLHKRSDGSTFWVEIVLIPINLQGKVVLCGSCRDISNRIYIQAESERIRRELTKVNERFVLAAKSAALGVWDLDLTNDVLEWDERCYSLYGLDKTKAHETFSTWKKSLHPEDAEEIIEKIWLALKGEITFDNEFRILLPNNVVRYLHTTAQVIRNEQKEPVRMIGVNWDITDRKIAQERLKTKTIQAENLARQAKDASKAKSEFVANMSHEIRTPLNGLIGMTHLLAESDLSPQQQQMIEIILSSGDALLTVINDILDFSKIEAGKLNLVVAPFNLKESLKSFNALITQRAKAKSLEYSCSIDSSLLQNFSADENRLRQVLFNLVGNALKFTERGYISLNVSREKQTSTHTWVRFTVTDTGIGVPDSFKNSLFEEFTQVDGSTSRQFTGTGLGLAICRKLVTLMNGNISFSSKVGVGSRFWFVVCLKNEANSQKLFKDSQSPFRSSDNMESPLNLHVLIAEDNKTNQLVTKSILKKLNVTSDVAENGREVLEALKKVKYDLVLMDLQMPIMDGYEATRIIRQANSPVPDRNIPIIALTAHAMNTDRDSCLEAGMNDHLSKPLSIKKLKETLHKWSSH